ncbi:MAG: hypothetical protein HQL86_07460, partial [Magnetococcales bacterium]|nr:hypothetical protein [Magnetococcales bacterium]
MAYDPRAYMLLKDNLDFMAPSSPGDPFYVDTEHARGEFSFRDIYMQLGINPDSFELLKPAKNQCLLFTGHLGCGKSSELLRLKSKLHDPTRYYVIHFDIRDVIDDNNCQYVDLLFASAQILFETMEKEGITIEDIYLQRLQQWFNQEIIEQQLDLALSSELKSEFQAGVSVPFFAKIMARLTGGLRSNASYKEKVRQAVRHTFAMFVDIFNALLDQAERLIIVRGLGKGLLFIVDNTDKLNNIDTQRFFVDDIHQLRQIRSNFIYAAQINLLFENRDLQKNYSLVHRLPMIRLFEKEDRTIRTDDQRFWEPIRQMVYKRVPREWFDSVETVDHLIAHSGGHPRDLVQLLHKTWLNALTYQFNRTAVDKAIKKIESEYRRLLTARDFERIRLVDQGQGDQINRDELVSLF